MYTDKEQAEEAVAMMYSGELSVAETWEILDNWDGDVFDLF